MRLIWVERETENFLMWDWTPQITLIRFNKTAFCENLLSALKKIRLSGIAEMEAR
jgi:hypothetical protein